MVLEQVEFVVIAALAAASFGLALPLRDRGVRERWRELAQRLGMDFEPGRLLESDGIAGVLGPYPVRIDNQRRQGTRVSVEVSRKLRGVQIRGRHLWFFEAGERPDDGTEGLPPAVARLLRQLGFARLYLLLLEAESEARLDAGIYSAHLGLEEDEVYLTCPERIDDPDLLGTILGGLARLAEGLEEPERIAERLGENARARGAPVRRRLTCFQLLLEHFPESTEGGRTAWSLSKGHSSEIPDGLRLRLLALRHLGTEEAQESLVQRIDTALGSASPGLRTAATEALMGLPFELAVPRLLSAARDPSSSVAATAVRALAVLGPRGQDDRAERALLDLLYRGAVHLRVDIVCALATLGTPRSIGPLLDLERVADAGLRRVARHAIDRLQRRFPERQSGSLSLVQTGGELSAMSSVGDP